MQETGLVVKHIESWNVKPGAVVKSLLNPSTKKPTTSWEKSAPCPTHLSVPGYQMLGSWMCSSVGLPECEQHPARQREPHLALLNHHLQSSVRQTCLGLQGLQGAA